MQTATEDGRVAKNPCSIRSAGREESVERPMITEFEPIVQVALGWLVQPKNSLWLNSGSVPCQATHSATSALRRGSYKRPMSARRSTPSSRGVKLWQDRWTMRFSAEVVARIVSVL